LIARPCLRACSKLDLPTIPLMARELVLAKFLGASESRLLHIYLMNERLVYLHENSTKSFQFYYYLSHTGQMIHWVEESTEKEAFQISLTEKLKQQEIELANYFAANEKAKMTILCRSASMEKMQSLFLKSYEAIATRAKS